jgi:hypothetical protein
LKRGKEGERRGGEVWRGVKAEGVERRGGEV